MPGVRTNRVRGGGRYPEPETITRGEGVILHQFLQVLFVPKKARAHTTPEGRGYIPGARTKHTRGGGICLEQGCSGAVGARC